MSDQSTQPQQPPHFDPKDFSTERYIKRVEKPWGYELHWVPEGLPYMGKVLHINEGEYLSLQVHDEKQESYFLISGRAALNWENDKGEMVTTELEKGYGYRTSVGQKHRISGLTDCDVIEASTPEAGTTWRLDDKYSRPDETPEQRKRERGEAV
jgi:mannose-6-phosphate isomerase